MRRTLIAFALIATAACTSAAHQRPSIVVAQTPIGDDVDADSYEQYVDEDGRVVTSQAANQETAKSSSAKPQTTRSRLFDHWTAAYLFTR
jgi:hypothetical protein